MKIRMYDIFKEKWSSNDIWLYSDPHFGDLDCYKIRINNLIKAGEIDHPFVKIVNKWHMTEDETAEVIKKLDQIQIDNINHLVHKANTLIILGDVGNVECVKKLKAGYKVLIMGNHDKGASNYKREKKKILLANDEIIKTEYGFKTEKPDVFNVESGVFHSFDKTTNTISEQYGIVGTYDNRLFNEVYEGPLFISDKIILSHESIYLPYVFNIHGHDHNKHLESQGFNCCAENINYTPIQLSKIVEGKLNDIDSIHRLTIDCAIERKALKK